MSQELIDFTYFRDHQLHIIDYLTGIITSKSPTIERYYYDVGSVNPDGYSRLWCNGKLRMKHRLVYFLYHGHLPNKGEEIDHYNSVRNANYISNLRVLTKSENNSSCANRKTGKRFTNSTITKVCELLQNTDLSDQIIANQTGVTRPTVRDIKTRRSRTSIGQRYTWPHRGY